MAPVTTSSEIQRVVKEPGRSYVHVFVYYASFKAVVAHSETRTASESACATPHHGEPVWGKEE